MKKKAITIIATLCVISTVVLALVCGRKATVMARKSTPAKWVRTNHGWKYRKKDGKYVKNAFYTIKNKVYYFGKNGYRKKGWQSINGKSYYFSAKGIRQCDKWMKNGTMYLGSNGAAYMNCLREVDGVAYRFDDKGIVVESNVVITKVDASGKIFTLEPYILNDKKPGTKDFTMEDFLTACVYAEAGGQGQVGMMAVALVMYNRLDSDHFPNDFRTVIYQKQQFAIVRDGNLRRVMNNPDLHNRENPHYEAARTAVRAARSIYYQYKNSGRTTIRSLNGFPYREDDVDFGFLYFMTPSSFENSGVDWDASGAVQYSPSADKPGHVFFRTWTKGNYE